MAGMDFLQPAQQAPLQQPPAPVNEPQRPGATVAPVTSQGGGEAPKADEAGWKKFYQDVASDPQALGFVMALGYGLTNGQDTTAHTVSNALMQGFSMMGKVSVAQQDRMKQEKAQALADTESAQRGQQIEQQGQYNRDRIQGDKDQLAAQERMATAQNNVTLAGQNAADRRAWLQQQSDAANIEIEAWRLAEQLGMDLTAPTTADFVNRQVSNVLGKPFKTTLQPPAVPTVKAPGGTGKTATGAAEQPGVASTLLGEISGMLGKAKDAVVNQAAINRENAKIHYTETGDPLVPGFVPQADGTQRDPQTSREPGMGNYQRVIEDALYNPASPPIRIRSLIDTLEARNDLQPNELYWLQRLRKKFAAGPSGG